MNRAAMPLIIVGGFVAFLLISSIAFIVPETHSAIVLRFGEPTQAYSEAGLKFKVPVADSVFLIDRRNRELDQEAIEIIAADQERLLVDAFARYRIVDPQTFYERARTIRNGESTLSSQMNQTVRRVLGETSVEDIVSNERAALMLRIKELLGQSASRLGVEIVDVKIRRADLPQQNSLAVFQRMITARNQLAARIRAEGNEAAQQVQAQADREATEIRAKANEESEKIRGRADAERNAVFAEAYGADPEFFAFYRSLLAYEEALQRGDTTILLSPDSEFFRYFNNLEGSRNSRP
ncbi:MAG: protease modulator HflC [Alphaproteobacteria bacterium]|nr:protease modulator HflC [Alphaproteobacteria bacterium]